MNTIRDVAKKSGLSIGTVSHYLNGKNVKVANKQKIEKAILDLNFSVNSLARGLKTNKTQSVGVLSNDLMSIFSIKIIDVIEDYFEKCGYSLILCNSRDDMENERRKLKFLKEKMVDGIILFPVSSENSHIEDILGSDIPLVVIDHLLHDSSYDAVLVDNINGSYEAVEHLITNGHRQIAIITGRKDISNTIERTLGYCRALNDYGIPEKQEYVRYGDFSIQSGYEIATELINMPDSPTAIFCANYHMAVGAINAINDNNLSIPNDISIVAFDMNLMDYSNLSVTSVIQPIDDIAYNSAQILYKNITKTDSNGNSLSTKNTLLRLKTKLIIKDSVKKLN